MTSCLGPHIHWILLQIAVFALTRNVEYAIAEATSGRVHVRRIGDEEVIYDREELKRTKRTLLEDPQFFQNSPITSSMPSSRSRSNHERESKNAEKIAALLQMIENAEEMAVEEEEEEVIERIQAISSRRPPPDEVRPSSTLATSMGSSLAPSISRQECAFCVRRPRLEVIGSEYNGNPIYLDVGTCRKRIKKKFRINHSRCNQCASGDMCMPLISRMERVHLPTGSSEHRVIVNCTCRERSPPRCVRRPQIVVFSPNSQYETSVDIGSCDGGCPGEPDGFSCQPVRNKTVALNGPNGASTVETIEECSCRGDCYRATHMESIYTVTWNSTTNYSQVTPVNIDVGKCVGQCINNNSLICLVWADDGTCAMSLTPTTTSPCTAKSRVKHTYVLPDGTSSSIYAITDCLCHSEEPKTSRILHH